MTSRTAPVRNFGGNVLRVLITNGRKPPTTERKDMDALSVRGEGLLSLTLWQCTTLMWLRNGTPLRTVPQHLRKLPLGHTAKLGGSVLKALTTNGNALFTIVLPKAQNGSQDARSVQEENLLQVTVCWLSIPS